MTKHKKTGGMRAVAFILAAAVLWGLMTGFGRAESVEVCLAAMEKCLGSNLGVGVLTRFWSFLTVVESCLLGYNFCRRYVGTAR